MAQALQDVLPQLLEDDAIDRAWLRFTDDTWLPEDAQEYARLSFKAGYATAVEHVSRVLGGVVNSVGG